jgi:hypothetical protein
MYLGNPKFGFTKDDVAYARSFQGWANARGWTSAQIEAAFEWYGTKSRHATTPAEKWTSFTEFMAARGVDAGQIELAGVWHDNVDQRGLEAVPVPSTRDADQKRLGEIRQLISSADYRHDDRIEREHIDVIDRLAITGPEASNVA